MIFFHRAKSVWAPCLFGMLLTIAEGLSMTAFTILLAQHERSSLETAIANGLPAFALLLGTFFMRGFIKKMGMQISLFWLLSGLILCTLAFLESGSWFWVLAFNRAMAGLLMGSLFLSVDAWVSIAAPAKFRGMLLGLYGMIVSAGFALGAGLNIFLNDNAALPFILASVTMVIAVVLIGLRKTELATLQFDEEDNDSENQLSSEIEPSEIDPSETDTNQAKPIHSPKSKQLLSREALFLASKAGLMLLFVSGVILEISFLMFERMIPWALVQQQGDETIIAKLITMVALGAVISPSVFGWLSDLYGRFWIILWTGLLMAISSYLSVFLVQIHGSAFAWLAISFIFGSAASGLIIVGWAALMDGQSNQVVLRRNVWIWRINQIGILAGAPLIGLFLDFQSQANLIISQYYLVAAVMVVFCLLLLLQYYSTHDKAQA